MYEKSMQLSKHVSCHDCTVFYTTTVYIHVRHIATLMSIQFFLGAQLSIADSMLTLAH